MCHIPCISGMTAVVMSVVQNDDGKEADYIVENFCAWKEVTI